MEVDVVVGGAVGKDTPSRLDWEKEHRGRGEEGVVRDDVSIRFGWGEETWPIGPNLMRNVQKC